MASIRTEIEISADPADVWLALRDWARLHERLAPGFVTDCRLDGVDRIVTFIDGTVVREVLVDSDDDERRLAWTIVDGPYTHHHGVAQILAGDDGGTRFAWTTDLLPDEVAGQTRAMMERGLAAIKEALERQYA